MTKQIFPTVASGISITSMTEHDLLEVVEIEEQSGLSRWGWSAYYAELHSSDKNLMLVAQLANPVGAAISHNLAGYIVARISSNELHINNVAVREAYRKQGIGRALLRRILEEGAYSGASTGFLEVRAGNHPALALYGSCGFRLISRRKNYYLDPVEDALVMGIQLVETLDPAH
jgi:ribosomal-protein-alanine N-acetyltransferase